MACLVLLPDIVTLVAQEAVDFIDENREAVRRVLVGCKDLPEAEGLAQRMSAGTYLLNFFVSACVSVCVSV